jgi:hypothetical protein
VPPKTDSSSMRTRSNTKPPPTIEVSKRSARLEKRRINSENDDDDEEQVKSSSFKRRKNNNKHDYQDEDEDYQDKDDDAKSSDESYGENIERGIKSDKSKWAVRYQDGSYWPDNGRYNLKEWEFKDKEKWSTPAACMDNKQRKNLVQTIKTWQKCASRYSQRPDKNWPAQEWVLLQITDIDGVGNKKNSTRKKTAVMAYGRSQAIKLYKKSLNSSGDTGNGAPGFVNHYTSNIDTLKSFWVKSEDQFITDEYGESTSKALGTTPVAESDKTPPPIPSKTGSQIKTSSGSGTTTTLNYTSNNDGTPPSSGSKTGPCKGSTEGSRTVISKKKNLSHKLHQLK